MLAMALATLVVGCTEVTPVRSPRVIHSNAYAGYTIGVPRTIDAGATIAHQVEISDTNPFAESNLVLNEPCKVIDHALLDNVVGTRSLQLQPGPLHIDATVASPTKLYLQKFPGKPGKGSALYLAVHPDGTIADRLWTEWAGENELDRNIAKISLEPADCRYVRSGTAPAFNSMSRPTGVALVYAGRDASGLLKFGQVQNGMFMQQLMTPAQPGDYDVLGLKLRVIRVDGYKLTYEVKAPAASAMRR